MATQLQIRRGTTAQMNAFTGAEGELAVNTTTDTVHVHDGSTAGGFALAKADGSNIGTYAGSFTTLTVDTNTLVVDATNNRVGIGTSSPRTLVNASSATGAILTLESSDTSLTTNGVIGGIDFYSNDSSTNGTGVKVNIRAIGQNSSGTATALTFGTSSSGSATAVEAFRVDASGNLLVGKTSAATNVEGGELRENGQVLAVATNVNPFFGARLGSDGDLAVFRKDSTTVGSIGSYSGSFLKIQSAGNQSGTLYGTTAHYPLKNDALSDASIDLGGSSNRFKDLYLSGGVNFSANANAGGMTSETLDDYEEGTWTPTVTSSAGSITTVNSQLGTYTKIGRIVMLQFQFNIATLGTASGNIIISGGIPFTEDNSVISYYGGVHRARSGTSSITEFDVGGTLQLYGTTPVAGVYYGSIAYNTAA